MFKVLLATDGSAFSLRAAEYVAKLVRHRDDVQIAVLYVEEVSPLFLSPTSAASLPGAPIPPDQVTGALVAIREQMDREKNTALEATMERFVAFGKRASSQAAQGKAADVICDIAGRDKYDLVVLGSSGKGRVSRALLGSVSHKVVNLCKVPVLVVR